MSFSYTLQEIATHVGGNVQGDANARVTGINALESAGYDDITFIVDKKYLSKLKDTKAGAVLILPQFGQEHWQGNAILVEDPYLAYAKTAELFNHKKNVVGIDASAVVAKTSIVAATASVGANVTIGNDCHIGENTIIKANVAIGDNVTIGDNCIIHQGVVIGSDGFGNAKDKGQWYKIPQIGGVVIGNNVEIGANTTIDCGAIGNTIIEDGVRVDNLVQIAHNVHIGAHTAIAAQTGIAGSAKIGKHCILAGQVGVQGHIEICDGAIFTGKCMVTTSVTKPGIYSSGTGMFDNLSWRKVVARLRSLDKLAKAVKALQKKEQKNENGH